MFWHDHVRLYLFLGLLFLPPELSILGNDKFTPDAPPSLSYLVRLSPHSFEDIRQAKLGDWRQTSLAWRLWPLTAMYTWTQSRLFSETLSDLEYKS